MELTDCVDLWVVWDRERVYGVFDDQDHAETIQELEEKRKGMDGYNDTRVSVTHKVLNER